MRFLILTQYYPPEVGGAQTRLAALARELLRRGHSVEVVTALPNHPIGRTYNGYRGKFYVREQIEGVDVHRTWVYAATGVGLKRVMNYISFALTSIFGVMRAHRPDILFVESPPLTLGASGWLASKLRRARLIFNISDLWPDSVRDLGVMRDGPILRAAEAFEGWMYRRSAVVNTVTDGIVDVLRTVKGVPERKIGFLPNGVDTQRFSPRPPDTALLRKLEIGEQPVLLYAGTHGIGMGLEHVLDAALLLAGEAAVVFVGAGPTKPMLVERAQKSGAKNVRFIDPIPLQQMPAYFSIAYASVVPLVRSEVTRGARPSKIFPALASGVPILYSGEGEGAELIREAGAGIVVIPENARALADAMHRLIVDKPLHDRMSENARVLAVERFEWSSIVEEWLRSLGMNSISSQSHR